MNVGIILALAGLDYSQIGEPDYNPEQLRQGPEITRRIEKVVEESLSIWKQGPQIRQNNRHQGKFFSRERHIFYDTDRIIETQRESVRACPDCGGLLVIDSRADRGSRILAVHIPRKACAKCREAGYQTFDSTGMEGFDRIFIQDRTTDEYFFRK
jgi:ribosomal protein S27AE